MNKQAIRNKKKDSFSFLMDYRTKLLFKETEDMRAGWNDLIYLSKPERIEREKEALKNFLYRSDSLSAKEVEKMIDEWYS